jgi:hypothetical protein
MKRAVSAVAGCREEFASGSGNHHQRKFSTRAVTASLGMLAALGLARLTVSTASAEEAAFGFVNTTDLLPQGGKEIEQWITWRHQKNSGSFDLVQGETEIEYGLLDNVQIALGGNYAWNHAFQNGPFGVTTPGEQFSASVPGANANFNQTRFLSVSTEIYYRILSPYTDPIGMALYFEPEYGDRFREYTGKLIFQKNFFDDKLVFALNFTYAPELRNLDQSVSSINCGAAPTCWSEETDVNIGFAGSYRFVENWSAGFEFENEMEFTNSFTFHRMANDGYYFGPTLHYGGEQFFVSVTPLVQMPFAVAHESTVPGALVNGIIGDNDFEKFRLRIKAGFTF